MPHPLADKVIIITGASSGIGAATARALAPTGARLVLSARSTEKLAALAAELGGALVVPADMTAPADITNLVARTVEHLGRVDVLFANAGIYIPGQVVEGTPDAWSTLLAVNIDSVLRCVHAVLPHMIAQQAGDILITSSISGFEDIHWEPVYSASKHAVTGFVHTLRRQVLAHGIRVMSVAPGYVANELWGYSDPAAIAAEVEKRAALTSENVAEAVLFMLSQPPNVTIRDLIMLPQAQDL
jgi:ribitol 2-dehydrogenase